MEVDSQRIAEELSQSNAHSDAESDLVIGHSVQAPACVSCLRVLSPDNEATGDLEDIGICGDCKFLFLEDIGTLSQDSYQRRPPRGRRTRHSSSESMEDLFSQQFTHMINLVRHNQSSIPTGHEDQHLNGEAAAMVLQHPSSHTTPSGSRRWRSIFSDTDIDGLDSFDSPIGESESNVSFRHYRGSHGESDVISFSTYGAESDASVDGYSFLDMDMFINPVEGRSNIDSDTDIDPMRAGINQWNSSDEEEEEEDGEWEEADEEEDTVEYTEARAQYRNFLISSTSESSNPVNLTQQVPSRQDEGTGHWRIRESRRTHMRRIYSSGEESELLPYDANSGDYLDIRSFEDLLGHLSETDIPRGGAPPAAVSFVKGIPHLVIHEEHLKHDGLACAVCKDVFIIGSKANQLPCRHLYHPSCILPWLSARNSCPLCRYELPTDDKDYEERKQNVRSTVILGVEQLTEGPATFSGASNESEADGAVESNQGGTMQRSTLATGDTVDRSGRGGGDRGGWFLLTAVAPIVSLVGVVFVLWLSKGRVEADHFPERSQPQDQDSGSPANQCENRSRRWWSLF